MNLHEAAKAVLAEWETYLNQYPHMDKGYMLDARDALRKAVNDAEGMGWQPIETAPKDGTLVVFLVDGKANLRRADDYWYGAYWLRGATHWMPLPAAKVKP